MNEAETRAEHIDPALKAAGGAWSKAAGSWMERAAAAKLAAAAEFTDKQRAFVDFVLAQYVKQGVEDELDGEKLAPLLQLKHRALGDAFAELGKPDQVRRVFVGFQRHLYADVH